MKEYKHGLCFRCEYRAQFFETGHGPRYECSGPGSVHGCYQYKPVIPIIVKRQAGDERPIAGDIIGARLDPVGLADVDFVCERYKNDYLIWARPRNGEG